MTDKLPPPLLALFQPRPPLRYLPPSDRAPDDCQKSAISGVAQFLADAKAFADEVPYNATESWVQRKLRQKTEKKERLEKQIADGLQNFNPEKDPQARGDPFKTLFVARLSYEVKEADLEREFGRFGPIERITLVKDTVSEKKKKAHQGYAFIVYEREKDMKGITTIANLSGTNPSPAYKETDGIRIKDRRVLVDVERGRTTKGWKPRRFGGGLGGRGYTKAMPSRPGGPGFNAPSGPGGYGGGFRGGFGGRGGGGGFRGGGFRGGGSPNAPSGPGGGRSGGFRGGYGGDRGGDRGSGAGRFDRGVTGSNSEPVRPRDSFADRDRRDYDRDDRYRDRDRDRMGDRGMGDRNGGDRYRDRDRERGGDRYGGGGSRDGGRDGGREDYGRKRNREDEPGHDDPRSRRRY
ncbi:Nucleotide-binding alpha-beta plait [Penicillium coprophilum]|uniref:Nucleotide-binding alpha-beta plait n=1 Tax=Penicillium coprophilum TaxID=36646 RepID=UPI0023A4DD2B|nr:Nucleotide-binding alpha-beta plait [Penicillium coprophilum]KAJ5178185.1 Nucleotide-binding alpha-beta plait [Penicillium coprophilum]